MSNLGDIVLTTPVYTALCDKFPDAVIDIVTSPAGEAIFTGARSKGKIIVRKRRQTLKERFFEVIDFRRERYDLAVDLKNSFLPVFSGARYAFPILPALRRKGHMLDVHMGVIKKLSGKDPFNKRFFITVSETDKKFVSGIMEGGEFFGEKEKRTVVINPGAKSHIKRWGVKNYAGLLKKFDRRQGYRVIMVGGKEDSGMIKDILDISGACAIDLSGKTTIGALYELIKHSDVLITNDSGPMHIASAAGTPTVAIFGPSNEKKYGPLAPGSFVLTPEVDCRPCEKALCSKGFNDGCISMVTPDRVFEAAKSILER